MRSSFFPIRHPTTNWVEGHVLGNGRLGGVVWGGPNQFHFGLSSHDAHWFGPRQSGHGWEASYPQLLQNVQSGDRAFLNRYGYSLGQAFPLSCGQLSLRVFPDEYFPRFIQSLDLRRAECRIRCTMHPERRCAGGTVLSPVEMTFRILAGCDIAEITLQSECRQSVELTYSSGSADGPRPAVFRENRMIRLLPENNSVTVALAGGPMMPGPLGLSGVVEFGGEAGPLCIRIAVSAGRAVNDSKESEREVDHLLEKDFVREAAYHDHFWKSFWKRSSIAMTDKNLELLWQFGIYALGCATSPDSKPPHLQGIWNQYRVPAWRSDYHFNVNIQEALWGCFESGHAETAESLVRCLLFDWRMELRKNASEAGLSGVMFPLCADGQGRNLCWNVLGMAMGMTAWMALIPYDFFRYTGKWEAEITDFLRECCQFQLSVLMKGADGKEHILLSDSPEQVEYRPDGSTHHVLGCDPSLDLSAARLLFRHYLELSSGMDDGLNDQVRNALEHFAPLPLQNGILQDYRTGYFEKGDAPGRFPWSHRHASRLFPLYPGGVYETFCDQETGRRSFQEFRSYGNGDFSSWSLAWQAILAARLNLPRQSRTLLKELLKKYRFPGGLFSHNPLPPYSNKLPVFQFEVFGGAVAAVNEMLMRIAPDGIRLFPGIGTRENAAFRNFTPGGGIFISAKKRKTSLIFLQVRFQRSGSIRIHPYRSFPGGTFSGENGMVLNLISAK